jgi:hypothetical protein
MRFVAEAAAASVNAAAANPSTCSLGRRRRRALSSARASGYSAGSSAWGRRVPSSAGRSVSSGSSPLQAVILNKAMSLVVVTTALPARLLGVPLDEVLGECHVIVNLLAGKSARRVAGRDLGHPHCVRDGLPRHRRAARADCGGARRQPRGDHLAARPGDRSAGGRWARDRHGHRDRRRASGLEDGHPGKLFKAAKWSVRVGLVLRAVRKPLGPGAITSPRCSTSPAGCCSATRGSERRWGSARHHRVVAQMRRPRAGHAGARGRQVTARCV